MSFEDVQQVATGTEDMSVRGEVSKSEQLTAIENQMRALDERLDKSSGRDSEVEEQLIKLEEQKKILQAKMKESTKEGAVDERDENGEPNATSKKRIIIKDGRAHMEDVNSQQEVADAGRLDAALVDKALGERADEHEPTPEEIEAMKKEVTAEAETFAGNVEKISQAIEENSGAIPMSLRERMLMKINDLQKGARRRLALAGGGSAAIAAMTAAASQMSVAELGMFGTAAGYGFPAAATVGTLYAGYQGVKFTLEKYRTHKMRKAVADGEDLGQVQNDIRAQSQRLEGWGGQHVSEKVVSGQDKERYVGHDEEGGITLLEDDEVQELREREAQEREIGKIDNAIEKLEAEVSEADRASERVKEER